MRRLLLGLLALLLHAPVPAQAATQDTTQFQLRIVALDCTIDIVDYGYGPIQVITCPEPPPDPEPEPTPSPAPEPSPNQGPAAALPPRLVKLETADRALLGNLYASTILGGAGLMLRIDNGAAVAHLSGMAKGVGVAVGLLFVLVAIAALWHGLDILRGGSGILIIPVIAHRWRKRKKQPPTGEQ